MTAGGYVQRQDRFEHRRLPGDRARQRVKRSTRRFPVSDEDASTPARTRVDRDYAISGRRLRRPPKYTLDRRRRATSCLQHAERLFGDPRFTSKIAAVTGVGRHGPACPNITKSYHETGENHKLEGQWQMEPVEEAVLHLLTGFRPAATTLGGNQREGAGVQASSRHA